MSEIKYFLKRLYYLKKFFKSVWYFNGFDYAYSLEVLLVALRENLKAIEDGDEIREDRLKKEYQIKKSIYLMESILEGSYLEKCGYDSGYHIYFEKCPDNSSLRELKTTETKEQRLRNKEVYKKAEELEEKEWAELFETLKKEMRTWWS